MTPDVAVRSVPARMTGEQRLLAAAGREPVDRTPVWFMRQAGGSLPRYLALRERHSVEEIATSPELCAAVSLMPVEDFGVDGAVMFADIMLPLAPMGVSLELTPAGPVVASPIRSAADVERLRPLEPEADLAGVLEAIRIVRREVGRRAAVIGICGGPFTLACYLVEGGPSRDQTEARAFMYREPDAWRSLMSRLSMALADYAAAQVRAGAQLIQLFDSWVGSLGPDEYVRFVRPWVTPILERVAAAGVPSVHFGVGTAALLELMAEAGGDVMGIDARQSLADAWRRLGPGRAVQGNLDPARLLAGWPAVEAGADAVLEAAGGRPGHVFNLGHAAPRQADPGILHALVDHVHERSRRD